MVTNRKIFKPDLWLFIENSMVSLERKLRENTKVLRKRESKLSKINSRIKSLNERLKTLETKREKFNPSSQVSNSSLILRELDSSYSILDSKDKAHSGYLASIETNKDLFSKLSTDRALIHDFDNAQEVTKNLLKGSYDEAIKREDERLRIKNLIGGEADISMVLIEEGLHEQSLFGLYMPLKVEDLDSSRKLFLSMFDFVGERTLHYFGPRETEGIFESDKDCKYLKFTLAGTDKAIVNYLCSLKTSTPKYFDESKLELKVYDARLASVKKRRPRTVGGSLTPQ